MSQNREPADLKGSQAAMQRAALRARELAEKTGTQLVVASRLPPAAANKTTGKKR